MYIDLLKRKLKAIGHELYSHDMPYIHLGANNTCYLAFSVYPTGYDVSFGRRVRCDRPLTSNIQLGLIKRDIPEVFENSILKFIEELGQKPS